MARPNVFSVDTTLYHPTEGERVFPAGETDPGAMWSDRIGGEAVGSASTTQALQDLIAAQEQIESLEGRLVAGAHDLAVSAKTREEALAKVAGLEQDAIAAKRAQADAEELARSYMTERDSARAELEALKAKKAKAEPEAT